MERVSKEFYVLSRMHEAGMVNEERSASDQIIAQLANMELTVTHGILETLERRQLVKRISENGGARFFVSPLGIIMASAIYT